MLIQYWRPDPVFPPLKLTGGKVSPEDKAAAALHPPHAVPQHCKPWLAAQSVQVLVSYPYSVPLAVIGRKGKYPEAKFLNSDDQPLRSITLTSLSPTYFTVNTEYRVVTPAGFGIYVTAAPDSPAEAIPGVIESWWYPKSLFVVFRSPIEGEQIVFRHCDPLCILVPVPCEDLQVTELEADEYAVLRQREQEYDDYRSARTDLQWMSAAGRTFSHAYRFFRHRKATLRHIPPQEVKS